MPFSVVVSVTGQVVTVSYVVIVVVTSLSHLGRTLLPMAVAAKARRERVAFILMVDLWLVMGSEGDSGAYENKFFIAKRVANGTKGLK